MTTTASASSREGQFPFDFAPQATQDADLLRQLDFVPGLKEVLTLRQVHALEHATVWVLSQSGGTARARADNELLGGMSTDQGFYLYGHVNTSQLREAVQSALQRIASGEWDLAVHPRCGTNLSVAMLLTAGLAVGINLALPRGPILQLLGLGAAAAAAAQLAPDVGALAQRYLTTAIPFNLSVVDISVTHDFWGREAHFVRVRWVE
jgi:Domain of unknown function (DUF6391)